MPGSSSAVSCVGGCANTSSFSEGIEHDGRYHLYVTTVVLLVVASRGGGSCNLLPLWLQLWPLDSDISTKPLCV